MFFGLDCCLSMIGGVDFFENSFYVVFDSCFSYIEVMSDDFIGFVCIEGI